MKILLDTNFVLSAAKFRVDIFSELEKFGKPEIFVFDTVITELEKLAMGKSVDSKAARLGLKFLEEKNVKLLKSRSKKADSGLLAAAAEGNFIVCTLDRELMGKIKGAGGRSITLRQKKYLLEK